MIFPQLQNKYDDGKIVSAFKNDDVNVEIVKNLVILGIWAMNLKC